MYRFYRYKTSRPYYSNQNIYYVCSWGGCGSQMLCHYLGYFGDVYHIHSRNPPQKLTKIGYMTGEESEWFVNSELPENIAKNIKVIFIYRNPIDCIYSRFIDNKGHLKNIQCDNVDITMEDCIKQNKDLYKLEEFFNNYVENKKSYNIYCVKYETLWDNFKELNLILNIPDIKEYYPKRNETVKEKLLDKELSIIYQELIEKMNKMEPIEVNKS